MLMVRNLCHPSTGARHFQKSPRVYPSCSRLILETAFALRSEYGRLSPSSRRFGKTRGISRWSGICIFCWFSKTENGWASCSTNQSLRRFSANSPQLRPRFKMRQRPRVWHAQGHEGHAEKFRRRIVSNAQPPPGFSNWDAFPPCKLCFGLFQRGDNFPIFAYCELSDRQKRFGCISNDRQLLGICLAQMLKNFKCAHGMKLPRAPPARNSFHGRHNSLVLALRRDPSWTTTQFD